MAAYVPIDLHRHRSVVMHMADGECPEVCVTGRDLRVRD